MTIHNIQRFKKIFLARKRFPISFFFFFFLRGRETASSNRWWHLRFLHQWKSLSCYACRKCCLSTGTMNNEPYRTAVCTEVYCTALPWSLLHCIALYSYCIIMQLALYRFALWFVLYRIAVCTELYQLVEVLPYVHRNRSFIRDGSPGRSPRLSRSSWGPNYESGLKRQACLNLRATDNGPKMVTMDRHYTKVRVEPRA